MVLAVIVAEVVNRTLGCYVQNLNSKQLQFAFLGGEVVLNDLLLKPTALDGLNLPIQVVHGVLGKLVIKISWRNIFSTAIVITIEDLYLLVVPNQEVKYDAEKEEKMAFDAKQEEIQRVEEAKKKEALKDKPKSGDSITEKVIANMIKNLQLKIKNIHIRYEDKITHPGSPFSLGVTLKNLEMITTDATWAPTATCETATKAFKVVDLEALAFYWNCKSDLYSTLSTEDLVYRFGLEVATKTTKPTNYSYRPINSNARLCLNLKPESDKPAFSEPKINLNLSLEKVAVGVSKSQYGDIIALSDSMSRLARGAEFRQYRPDLQEYKGHAKEWWHFAYKCILESEVRRRRKNWDWNHIRWFRQLCKEYGNLYQTKLQSRSVPTEVQNRLTELEKELDTFNIIIIRQKVELEAARLPEADKTEKGGWFSGWFGSKPAEAGKNDSSGAATIVKKFEEAMTPEEKDRLYKAIDYQENAAPAEYPLEFVDTTCIFVLNKLEVVLVNDELQTPIVLNSELSGVKCRIDRRIAASAMKVAVNVNDLTTYGLQQDDFLPQLVSSNVQKENKVLLDVVFETNPLDGSCDKKIYLNAEPLRIIYDAQTINRSIEIFKVPESSALEKLSTVAGNGLSNIKQLSVTGMQHAISQHSYFDIEISIHAPICLLPYGGKYLGEEHLLIVNLGLITITTEPRKLDVKDIRQLQLKGANEDQILKEMIAQTYDEYKVNLTELQIIFGEGSEDWETYMRQSESTKMHLLNPVNLRLKFYKCLLTDDPRLPLSRITGELPSVNVTITDTRLVMLLDLLMSVPFQTDEEEELPTRPLSESKSHGSSVMLLKYLEMQEKAKSEQSKVKKSDEQLQQFTSLDMKFVMSEMSLNLNHQEHSEDPITKVVNFKVTNLEVGLIQQTFNKKVEVRLASIDLNHFRSEALIPLISTPFSTGSDQYLFTVEFTQVDKDSPEFHSKYHSCESNLFLHFSCLNVLLHQESLQELLKFQTDTQNDLNEIMNSKPTRKVQNLASKTSIRSGISRQISEIGAKSSAKFLTPAVKKKKNPLVVDTILFKLNAKLDQVEVKFISDLQEISLCAIKGVTSNMIVKKSYTEIKAHLLDMVITDLNQKSIHKKILTVSDEYALDARIIMYNLEELEVVTEKNVDMAVDVTMGRLKIVFLNWFVSNMLDFLNNFQAAQEKIREASAAAADAAKQNMKDAYEKAKKISLSVDLRAPYIVVPVDSSSYHAVEVDLGHLAITNNFIVLEILNENLYPAVVDEMKLKLTDMRVQRIELDMEHKVVNTCELLEPLTFILTVRRNLSTSWYEAVPDMSLAGSIKSIKLLLSQADYQMLMSILSGNLQEGKISETPLQPPSQPKTDAASCATTAEFVIRESISESTGSNRSYTQNLVEEKVHISLKFNFAMESFIIDLFTGGAETNTPVFVKKEPKTALGRFSLLGLSMKGRMLSDNSMVVSMLLVNCLLDDMRAGREDKLNRLIERKLGLPPVDVLSTDAQESIIAPKSMIDITYQRTKTDMFSDVRIYSFTVILSVDYLNKIADFFKQPSAPPAPEVATTASKTQIQKVENSPKEDLIQQTINLKVEMPDIILVEHMDNEDTNAMILNTEIILNARMCGKHQVLNGTVRDIQLYTCCYNPKKRAETRGEVIHPVTISVAGSTPEDEGLHLEVIFTDIRIRVSPDTIELLNRVLVTMSGGEATNENDEDELKDHSTLWDFKSFADSEFWFLKTDVAQDALAVESIESELLLQEHHAATRKKQLCFLTMPSLVFTVEAGVGNRTLPMLLLESSFRGYVNDWSSKISIDTSLTLQMGYYNSNLALWEPLIEPVEVVEGGKSSYVPWEIKLEVAMNESSEQPVSPVSSPVADNLEQIEVQLQPAMSINVSSINNLELTVTKTCLDVLKNLGNAFSNAVKSTEMKQIKRSAAFLVQNDTGIPITLCLDRSTFAIEGAIDSVEVILESDANVPLTLKSSAESRQKLQLKQEITKTRNEIAEHLLHVKVEQANCELSLPVVRADKRFFLLNYRAFKKDNWGLVSAVKVEDGVKIITLRSIVQVHNHFNIPVEIFYMTEKGDELKSIAIIQPGVTFNVPLHAVYSITNELFFSVDGYSVTTIPYIWKDLQSNVEVKKTLLCTPRSENVSQEPFVIQAVGEIEQIYYENTTRYTMASTCFNIHLRPSVVVKNCLPVDIICCGQNIVAEILVKAGETIQLPNVNPGNSYVVIRLPHYLEKEWSCRRDIPSTQPEFSVWQFDSHDSVAKMTLDLGMHVLDKNGTVFMSLYCPFWMLNKTGLMLSYKKSRKTEKHEASGSPSKTSDENLNILHHPADFKGPILFSFNAKNFFGKKKASVRIEYGEWSDKFSLDVAGSSGVVACRNNNHIYQIGVHNQLTYNSLTKQVTFTPYYILINNAPFTIECQEFDRPADSWKRVEPKSCTALWPKSERDDKLLKLKIEDTEELSAPFLFTESHTTLLKLKNKYGGVNVDIQLTEGGVFISFAQYQPGMAPALIINHTPYTMSFWEKETVQIRKLYPNHNFLYTWENPSGPRVLAWDIGRNKELNDDLRKDGGGEFSPKDDFTVYWVSFLNGMQRTLLFTTEQGIAEDAQSAKQFELIDREMTVSIHGLGLSLVNNETLQEIMYMGIASSGVIWETSKNPLKRFKQMQQKDSALVEAAYQQYLKMTQVEGSSASSNFILDNRMEVDFETLTMLKPSKKIIRRTFLMGLWLQMKNSATQLQLHAKINRLQIDNQIYDCLFPVVLAPVPPPKSVALASVHKPFMEVSIVQLLVKHSQIRQFKYFKVLIQEFHIKVELGFVNAVMEVLQAEEYTEQEQLAQFREDLKLVDMELYEKVSFQSLKEQKSFYDLLHFSPLKIHVSFSLAASGSSPQGAATPNFINVLLQGLGVTLTDMQDVVFKLAYFEREYKFLTQKQLIQEATSHYVGQMVKQLYVLVLGLDVLGNPYGLVLGITKGVEDLFYEPFQGAIQGPGEFAEGLVLGVRSLFGHTVGGAAGAVSRITGAVGKGLAALTFDKDYQRKRRDQISKKPATVQEGIARGGKGLVMGVYDGVTGVFTKPITGAKEKGVEGFFTGLGKGAVGLFARPTAGVIDFASGSLDAVKRATDLGEETHRLRAPRCMHSDHHLRPYNRLEAEGNRLLKELGKGKYATTDVYCYHHTIVDKKEILLLTDKRIAYVMHNDIFGGWQIEWSYTWQDLSQPATIAPRGVHITVSEKKRKGLFGSSDAGKTILISNPELREQIVEEIESLRGKS